MDGLSEFLELVTGRGRRVYVAERQIDLRDLTTPNTVYVLQLPEGSTAAGGRAGGLGERRIVMLYHFRFGDGNCSRVGLIEDDERLDSLDLPYHATAMPVIDTEGRERLVSGVIDPPFVESYGQSLS